MHRGSNVKNEEIKNPDKIITIGIIGALSVILIVGMIFGISYFNRQREIKQADALILIEKYDQGIAIYDQLLTKKYSETIMYRRDLAVELMTSAENLQKGLEAYEEGDINKAVRFLSKVSKKDTKGYELALEELMNIEENILSSVKETISVEKLKVEEVNYEKENKEKENKEKEEEVAAIKNQEQAEIKKKNQEEATIKAMQEAELAAINLNNDIQVRNTASSIVGTYRAITAGKANLRDAPTMDSGIVTILPLGARVYIYETQIESAERIWCYVATEENGYMDYGWISYNTMNSSIK